MQKNCNVGQLLILKYIHFLIFRLSLHHVGHNSTKAVKAFMHTQTQTPS